MSVQSKVNTNTTFLIQDQISIKEFLQTKKSHKFNEEQIT